MILDSLWLFSGATGGVGNNDGKTDSPTTGSQTSSNIIDLGVGSAANPAIPASAAGGGARDIGIGDDPSMKFMVLVTVAFTSGTSLQINVQGAPDNGAGVPGAFTVMEWGPVVAEAQLVIGARLMDLDFPRPAPNQPLPRFIQLGYVSVGTHVTGKLEAVLVLDRADQVTGAPGVWSGYTPGIVVAN